MNFKFIFFQLQEMKMKRKINYLMHQSLGLLSIFLQKLLNIINTFRQTLLLVVLIQKHRPHGFLPP